MSTLKVEESGEGGPPGEVFFEKDKRVGKEKLRGEISGESSGDIVKVITVLMIITIADMLQIILFFLKGDGMKVQNA